MVWNDRVLKEESLIASDLKYPDCTGETYSITYNPPISAPGKRLIGKDRELIVSEWRMTWCAHSAFGQFRELITVTRTASRGNCPASPVNAAVSE